MAYASAGIPKRRRYILFFSFSFLILMFFFSFSFENVSFMLSLIKSNVLAVWAET